MSDYCPCFAATGTYGCEPLGTCRPSGDGAMSARDDRIEHYYNWGAWDLAERIVDLEDEKAKIRAEVRAETLREAADWLGSLGEASAAYLLHSVDVAGHMAEGAS